MVNCIVLGWPHFQSMHLWPCPQSAHFPDCVASLIPSPRTSPTACPHSQSAHFPDCMPSFPVRALPRLRGLIPSPRTSPIVWPRSQSTHFPDCVASFPVHTLPRLRGLIPSPRTSPTVWPRSQSKNKPLSMRLASPQYYVYVKDQSLDTGVCSKIKTSQTALGMVAHTQLTV